MREVPSVMGFFRKKHRESAMPLEDVAEDEGATPHRGFKGFPNLTGSSPVPESIALMGADTDPLSRKRNRAEADPEDDSAESQLIDEERHREQY